MPSREFATFAAGCFWGVEKLFAREFGPKGATTAVGYMGGTSTSPTYQAVCSGATGHAEALQLQYDPSKIEYASLVDFFYRIHDPRQRNRQGNDVGTQYRSVIFTHTPEQERIAREVTDKARQHWKSIATEIVPASTWYPAEDYHQSYLDKTPNGYECPMHRVRQWMEIEGL
ncbi:hypothetical protein CXG81DRAFT_8733 [Caulochytrium protostelioides]|uniref:peptide-methionine (S)-S-oxide reductase n=1 Tax=Caulochytrium protostelioides TaxID=1555241 RepID=A0A4P9XER3_9FUNG|nr:hypothetical protein CXG81DRAFT_8733 [Caulochytrium protostelioides]|eukprot:RKP04047.1 hypothetical protein CXG81DRAFT_8733 [Caulochytrium protostelioides]